MTAPSGTVGAEPVPLPSYLTPQHLQPACEDAQMSSRAHAVDPARLARWCMEHLGSPPAGEIFRAGYLSAAFGGDVATAEA